MGKSLAEFESDEVLMVNHFTSMVVMYHNKMSIIGPSLLNLRLYVVSSGSILMTILLLNNYYGCTTLDLFHINSHKTHNNRTCLTMPT